MINKLINTEYNKKNITHTTTINKTNKKKPTNNQNNKNQKQIPKK